MRMDVLIIDDPHAVISQAEYGGVWMQVPAHAREIRDCLYTPHPTRPGSDQRAAVRGRLSAVINKYRLYSRVDIAYGVPASTRALAEEMIKAFIHDGIILRRPFEVDEVAADAWLAATILGMRE